MKRTFLTALLSSAILLGGCAYSAASEKASSMKETAAPEPAETAATASAEDLSDDTLVAYFSVTGHTEEIARQIASITNAPEYVITPEEPYTEDDIDYGNDDSRTSKEQNDPSARPAIGGAEFDLDGTRTLYLGYPIWWGQEPRIMDTFVESHDFTGVTVIPFCTSASSGVGNSASHLAELAGSGDWKEGTRFAIGTGENEIRSWIESMQ